MPELTIVRDRRSIDKAPSTRPAVITELGDAVRFVLDETSSSAVIDPAMACRFGSPVYVGRIQGHLYASNCVLAYLAMRLPDAGFQGAAGTLAIPFDVQDDDLLSLEISILACLESTFGWDVLGPLASASSLIAAEKQKRLAILRCLLTQLATSDASNDLVWQPVIDLSTEKIRNLTGAWI